LSFDMNLFKDRQSKNFYIWKKFAQYPILITYQKV
jgi:hypothetical protein